MNWKVFITAFVSASFVATPQNGVSCGPSEDPHDYFTSFFNSTTAGKEYEPFYYTALLPFYDGDNWNDESDSIASINQKIVEEWKQYGKASKASDAASLVYGTSLQDLNALLTSINSGKALPVSLAKNSLAQNLAKEKNSSAVSYLVFAKTTEEVSTISNWEDGKHDSLQINKLINEASSAYAKATDAFLKNKYAFQLCKLAFYNNRNADCIKFYNEHFSDANTSAVNALALSYKAGSLYRSDKKTEAAYAFSKTFSLTDQNKKSNFQGFLWATDFCDQKNLDDCLALCKSNAEKANMIAMFTLYGTQYKLQNLKRVYSLNPSSSMLTILATREISKLEEQYFTPILGKEKGGKALYVSWADWRDEENGDKKKMDGSRQTKETAQFFEQLMNDASIPNKDFYAVGAAYLHFMNKDYATAKSVLAKANEVQSSAKVKDQQQLINLLIAANEAGPVTKEREAQILPSMKWLVQKAKTDTDYRLFCRNFFSEILAQKYEQQNDPARAGLAYGLADLSFIKMGENDYYYSYPPAIDFVHNEMNTESLMKLYDIMNTPSTETEKFLVQNSSVKRDNVIDVIGTSYLRDKNYVKAMEWLSKAGKLEPLIESQYNYDTGNEKTVNVDPFYDYLNDWQRLNKSAAISYTKLSLAKKLLDMKTSIDKNTGGVDKAKLFYQYASALYNMSYYGNSWEAVAYYRSSNDWNEGTYKLPWEKEYYGVYEAKNYYQKAYDAATDKEYKAACLFMVAKCAQRQVPRPTYDYKTEGEYEKKAATFDDKFKNNALFGKFKSEFGTTKFYQYAYNRCSYLRDYVKQGSTPMKTTTKPKGKG